ncbi:MAG: starch-binding protein [Ruminococcus sp.]|nr:starch-binding protein [Ruminococcus sp.]
MKLKNKAISSILAVSILATSLITGSLTSNAVTVERSEVSATTEQEKASASSQGPQKTVDGSNVLHCFNWSYNSIKENLEDIKAAGYTAVQTSPVQPPKDYKSSWKDQSGQWWKLYQPIDISIADSGQSWLGTKAELKEMCAEADKYGIKVIVDIVANHMANIEGKGNKMSDIHSSVNSTLRSNSDYWHINSIWASDSNRYDMTRGSIGEPDLNTGNSYIQKSFKNLLVELIGLGVDGFRFDAAKHIELPTDSNCASDFWPVVVDGSKATTSNPIYYYGEILNTASTDISNYTKYINVTDNKTGDSALYGAYISDAGMLASSSYVLEAGASHSVLWVESHDTYMGDSGSINALKNTSGVSDAVIKKAWAIIGARAKSTSLFFARPAANMGDASTDTTWKSTAVKEVNKFKNYFDGQSEYLSSSGKVAYIERGTTGVVISKLDGGGNVSLKANKMVSGSYKDQISGRTFTVSNGTISGEVSSSGVAVVYNCENTPIATASPESTTYKTDTLKITLNCENATTAYYAIDNSEYKTFKNGDTITIGSGLPYGSSTVVSVKASDGTTTSAVSKYTYVKKDPSETLKIYFDNTSYKWSKVYAYVYDKSTGTTVKNAVWPGEAMTYNSATGYYELEVEEKLANAKVIFTESSTATTNRYPADGATGLSLDGKSMLFSSNHSWKEYVPVPTTTASTTVPPTTVTEATTVSPTTTEPTTDNNYVLIGDADCNDTIDVNDATLIQQYLVELSQISKNGLLAADTDADKNVNIKDATAIQYYLNGISSKSCNCGVKKNIDDIINPTTTPTVAPTTVPATTVAPTTEPATTKPAKYTMTFTNSLNWSGTIYCYYWSDTNKTMSTWPGKTMSYSKTNSYGQSIYTYDIPSDAQYVIFSNGSVQTENVTVSGSARYYVVNTTDSKGRYNVSTW